MAKTTAEGSATHRPRVYSEQRTRDDYRRLTLALIDRKLTITTMESATAGQVASLITDTEGSSAVLEGAYVTYCNAAKIKCGVPREVIETYTVYSEQTAAAMAEACRRAYNADIGIGVTGTMGNVDPANPEASEPGQVYVGICLRKRAICGRDSTGPEGLKAGEPGCPGAGGGTGNAPDEGDPTRTFTYHLELTPQPTRLAYKLAVAQEVYDRLAALIGL